MKIDGNDCAHPILDSRNGELHYREGGIPIRLAIAAQLMASTMLSLKGIGSNADACDITLKLADTLIARHNATTGEK